MKRIDIPMTKKQKAMLDNIIGDKSKGFGLISQPTMNTEVFKVVKLDIYEFKKLSRRIGRYFDSICR